MIRPNPLKPDNFFLLLFNALRQRRVPIALRIVSHSLLLVAAALLIYTWVMGMQFKQAMQQQADALGQSLLQQTARSAGERLVVNDNLGLNVLLSELVKNPLVAHAALYSVDNRILAEAGRKPSRSLLGEDESGLYSMPLTLQETMVGHLRLTLDMEQFQQPMTISLQSMGLLSLILLALSLSLSLRLGRQLTLPLLQLRLWLRDINDPVPGTARQDELGDLARQLKQRFAPAAAPTAQVMAQAQPLPEAPFVESFDEPFDEPFAEAFHSSDFADEPSFAASTTQQGAEDELEDDAFADLQQPHLAEPPSPAVKPASPGAVLVVQLGEQDKLHRLPRARLHDLLSRYRDCLVQGAALYQGRLHTLSDGSSLVLFDGAEDAQYLIHALCCGELMRALSHSLQIAVADSGITLQLQLSLTLASGLTDLGLADLLLHDQVQAALALALHSRNLLLVDASVAAVPALREQARIRPIVSPPGASCVERLLDPYPAQLERQLSQMHD